MKASTWESRPPRGGLHGSRPWPVCGGPGWSHVEAAVPRGGAGPTWRPWLKTGQGLHVRPRPPHRTGEGLHVGPAKASTYMGPVKASTWDRPFYGFVEALAGPTWRSYVEALAGPTWRPSPILCGGLARSHVEPWPRPPRRTGEGLHVKAGQGAIL